MDKELKKLLLTELNIVSYIPGSAENLTDEDMAKALTANDNLMSLGYTLKPADIVRLASSISCDGIYEEMVSLLPDVKAEPMYPDFPTQVMNMSEAEFRFHQMIHYFSTYGVEYLTGTKVNRGWLPNVEKTEKTVSDTRLLDSRVLELVAEDEICFTALKRILEKRERMTIPETMIVRYCSGLVQADSIYGLRIAFKENIELIFDAALSMDKEAGIALMHAACQHSGDALKNIYRVLRNSRFHFRTSQKKQFVRLLETYSVKDLSENLMKSKYGREKNLLILQKLDYNSYSRSEEHKAVVNDLRNDRLKSWEAVAKHMLENHMDGALDFVAGRPGTMLRMVNMLLNLGYEEEEITEKLCMNARVLSTQTIVSLLNKFAVMTEDSIHRDAENDRVSVSFDYDYKLSVNNRENLLWHMNREIDGIRVEAERERIYRSRELMSERNRKLYEWSLNGLMASKEDEIEILKIPYNVELSFLREEYLSRKEQIENRLSELRTTYRDSFRKKKEREVIRESVCAYMKNIGNDDKVDEYREGFTVCDDKTLKAEKECRDIEKELADLRAEYLENANLIKEKMNREIEYDVQSIEEEYALKVQKSEEMREAINLEYNPRISEIQNEVISDEMIEEKVAKIREEYEKKIEDCERICDMLRKEKADKLRMIDMREVSAIKQLRTLPVKRRIFRRVLESHFKGITTSIKGKKVLLDMGEFDLNHSQILGSQKSAEGGYIPSGIAYRIPEDAKRVRFFAYWNDEERVDVDLHARGITQSGEHLHVGWNGAYNDSGVTHSGDITHSNAAEYIDIDMSKPVKRMFAEVALFDGKESLSEIDECYVGMMAVDNIGKQVKLYDRANCYFTHDIRMNCTYIYYGYIDVENRYVKFIGKNSITGADTFIEEENEDMFTLDKYLNILFESQNVTIVTDIDEADVVLSMGKSLRENGLSLIDENFFMDV